MVRKICTALIPVILAALPLCALWFELTNYVAHADAGFLAQAASAICAALSFSLMIRAARRKKKARAVMLLASCAIGLFAVWCASKIPNCPVCDLVTKEDLGFLARWIPTEG